MNKQTTYIVLAFIAGCIIAYLFFYKKGTVKNAGTAANQKYPPNSPGTVQCLNPPCDI